MFCHFWVNARRRNKNLHWVTGPDDEGSLIIEDQYISFLPTGIDRGDCGLVTISELQLPVSNGPMRVARYTYLETRSCEDIAETSDNLHQAGVICATSKCTMLK